ncbi:MAG: hypothetical protein DRP45_00220 [Candidatus Zixiibacteriota bacterium]|nr:MAG: hypothetical protein DRP45_00220 [candidate division Zixibacteria bacterium]
MNRVVDTIKRYFISGVLVVVPVILTFIVLRFLFNAVDGILQPILHPLLGYYRTGLGALTTILIILLAGVATRNIVGARLYRLGDRLLARVPLIRPIYSSSKQLLEALTTSDTRSFQDVAMIEYPRKGIYALCFVSHYLSIRVSGEIRQFATCFIASTPTPVSGMVVVVPVEDLMIVDMTIEQGVKFFVSGGVASPELIKRKPETPAVSCPEVDNETG